jgi:hypothetical protein
MILNMIQSLMILDKEDFQYGKHQSLLCLLSNSLLSFGLYSLQTLRLDSLQWSVQAHTTLVQMQIKKVKDKYALGSNGHME